MPEDMLRRPRWSIEAVAMRLAADAASDTIAGTGKLSPRAD